MEDSNKLKVHMQKTDEMNELTFFFNGHMRQLMAAKINIKMFGKLDPKEVVAGKPVMMPGVKTPVIQKITAEQALTEERKIYIENKRVVEAIKELMKEL